MRTRPSGRGRGFRVDGVHAAQRVGHAAVLRKAYKPRGERPSAAEEEQQNEHRGDEEGALERALRRADLGGSVVPGLGWTSIPMSSSIAFAEKCRSLGSFERDFMITASMPGVILLLSLRGGVGSLCMCCLARLRTSPENGGLPVRQW